MVHFLQQFERAALRSTRYLSAACMGQLVGTTAGVLTLAPLANALGQIHVLTVGATLAGGVGAVAALALERRRAAGTGSATGDAVLGAAAGLKSLPDFVYPTLHGATQEERAVIHRVLDGLPMGDVTSASTMTVMDGMGGMGISGVAPPALSQNVIYLDRENMGYRWFNEELVTHELGHAKDLSTGYGPFGMLNQRTPPFGGPFGRAPFVSSYADTNLFEDYAESYTEFHRNPDHLRRVAPEKLAVLEQQNPDGFSEWLTDRPSVRSAGKGVADAVGTVPYLRNGLELAFSLVGPLEIHRGSRQWEEGVNTYDAAQRARGKFNLATGLLLMSGGGAPFALAAAALHGAVKAGDARPETAEKAADLTLAASLGPLGMITLSAARELEAAGFDLSKRIDSFGKKPSVPDPFEAVASGVVGAALGGVAGAAVGSLASGLGGAAFGAACGQLVGAAAGLGLHALKSRGSQEPPPDRLALRAPDKRLLLGTAGGALAGGVIGGTAGGYLGLALGRTLGHALAGPVGASTGAFLGRLGGMLAGSGALARAGAALGRALVCPQQGIDQAAQA